jgi:glutathione S-transferase
MKLYVTAGAPNPRRVTMFMAEKGIEGIEQVPVDLRNSEHRSEAFRAISPMGGVPALVLEDGRALTETRAICTYLEGLQPEPNLMGTTSEERAFIEMANCPCNRICIDGNRVKSTDPFSSLSVADGAGQFRIHRARRDVGDPYFAIGLHT